MWMSAKDAVMDVKLLMELVTALVHLDTDCLKMTEHVKVCIY